MKSYTIEQMKTIIDFINDSYLDNGDFLIANLLFNENNINTIRNLSLKDILNIGDKYLEKFFDAWLTKENFDKYRSEFKDLFKNYPSMWEILNEYL